MKKMPNFLFVLCVFAILVISYFVFKDRGLALNVPVPGSCLLLLLSNMPYRREQISQCISGVCKSIFEEDSFFHDEASNLSFDFNGYT